ncbi:MAG: EamA family transporter [Candidatus Latescibacterota bacterium]|nr:MAG: EamA family transporter [Candidatus Latescibacterota bacterium]
MIKVGLEGAPPITAAGLRFILASIVIFSILIYKGIKLPRDRKFLYLSLYLGFFQMAIPYALVYWAEQHITSGLTSILFSTMPFTVAILARIFLGDPLTIPKVAGITIGTIGVVVIFYDGLSVGSTEALLGIAATLLSAVFASVSSIVIKRFSRQYNPLASIFVPMVIGGIVLTAVGRVAEANRTITFDLTTVFSIVYLAVLGSVAAFGLYYWIIKHMDVTALSYQTFIIPILACVIGWIFLRETVTLNVAFGGGMIVIGIALATLSRSREKRIANVGVQ